MAIVACSREQFAEAIAWCNTALLLLLQGFWWSHITWLFSTEASMLDYANAPDLKAQWFYR